jgi:cytochrome c553
LIFFRSGTRKSVVMQPIVEQMSEEEITALAHYLAHL